MASSANQMLQKCYCTVKQCSQPQICIRVQTNTCNQFAVHALLYLSPNTHTHPNTLLFSRWCLLSPLNITHQQRVSPFSANTHHNGFLCKLALMVLYTPECSRSLRVGRELRRNAELKTNMTQQLWHHYSRATIRVKNDLRVFTDSMPSQWESV